MSAQKNRLGDGGRINRGKPLRFTFNGRDYQGYEGDTLASALLANNSGAVARSFKYHRPRGIYSAGVEEPNAVVQLETGARTRPNLQATEIELYDGLSATSVNCWPTVEFDTGAINSLAARLLPAGFYYKTFMWPKSFWMTYERVIRNAAGLGKAPTAPDPDTYHKRHAHTDVLVVGGGPAGLAAALAAGRTGARVILAEQEHDFGGRLLSERGDIDGIPAGDWVGLALAELNAMEEVTVLGRTTCFGYYDHNYLGMVERCHINAAKSMLEPKDGPSERLWRVRSHQVVLATGAIERPLVFADNDRPGVMLAGALRAYLNRYAVRPGCKAVIFTNNDDAYRSAIDLHDSGVEVTAVIDLRVDPDGPLPDAARARNIQVMDGWVITRVLGNRRLRAIEIQRLTADGGAITGEARRIDCDVLGSSGGWNPVVHLHSQSGAKARFDDALQSFVPGPARQAERSAGAANGAFALDDCLGQGHAAGLEAAKLAGFKSKSKTKRPTAESIDEAPLKAMWIVPGEAKPGHGSKHFIDLHNDVTVADIELAAREGFHSVEHVKRYTTLGMGPDQGKTGNIPGMAVLAGALDTEIASVGTTTFRPPFTPVTYGALAGRDIGEFSDPARKTALHHWHEQASALFEDVGQWKRPWYYPKAGETMQDSLNRECLAVRHGVGILDATTLGKIDIQGPDAAEFLNRIYTNAWSKLAVGRCRYGLMLGEDGMVMDDGVTARLAENHFHMTTTTGNAARVLGWLEEWLQTEWPELKVYCNSVTEYWATMTVCGPRSRDLLAEFTDIDLSAEAFPFMSFRQADVGGVAARIFRISFTGELSYEINVPASHGLGLWTALMTAGEKYGITPYGTETMHILRAEKGYIIVGQETDGTMTPNDLGMDWIVSTKKDFIGRRSLSRTDCTRPGRKQLVGLLTDNPSEVLPEGAQLVFDVKPQPPMDMVGHVTSSYYSAALGRSIALAVVKGGADRMGETIHAPLIGKTVNCKITGPVFYDPDGSRIDGA